MISKNDYDLKWDNYFIYTEDSPSGLRWKNLPDKAKSVKVGDVAGTKQYRKNGEPSKWMVKFMGKNYSCAKIVFILNHGYIENHIIVDHIDTDPFNNNIQNLRATTEPLNLKNKKYQRNNTSGFTGVSVVTKFSIKYYVATWIEDGKQRGKSFSTKTHGDILAKMKAICFRYEKLKEIDKNVEYSVQHYNLDEQQYKLIKEAADEIESYVQFAWATFDGEGGYDLVLYDMNEDYKDDYIKRNGEKYKDWVVPLYVKET